MSSVHLILRHTLWIDFIIENKDVDHLVKVVVIRFSTSNYSLRFVVNRYLCGKYFEFM